MEGFVIGACAVIAGIIYFEIRHAYFSRKIKAATETAQAVAADAKSVAQAAQTAVEQVKKAV
jgi:hypothetical protein